jgi:hypothetical protein
VRDTPLTTSRRGCHHALSMSIHALLSQKNSNLSVDTHLLFRIEIEKIFKMMMLDGEMAFGVGDWLISSNHLTH